MHLAHNILVYITQITYSRLMNGEMWITSDGRAYLVGLHGNLDQGHPYERSSEDQSSDVSELSLP
jgi:hypothetical protein